MDKKIHTLTLSAGSIFGSLSVFGSYILVANNLSIYEFGLWSALMAITAVLSSLVALGVPGLLLKLSSETGQKIFRWVQGAKLFIVLSASLVAIFLIGWSLLGHHSPLMAKLLLILIPYMLNKIFVDLIHSKFQVEESYIYLSLWQFIPQLVQFIFVLVLTSFPAYFNVTIIVYIYTFLAIINMLIGFYVLYGLDYDRKSLKAINKYNFFSVAKEAWPFGVAGLLYFIYFQSDIVILKYIVGEESAAEYGIAFIVMYSIYFIPSVITQKYLLSKFHYLSCKRLDLLKNYYYDNVYKVFIAGLIISILVWSIAPYLVPFLFGEKYQQVVFLIFVLLFAVPIRFVSIYAGIILTTKNHIRNKIKFMGIAALFNIIFNLLLIPEYQEFGAAIVTLMSEFLLMIMYIYSVKNHVFDK